MFCHEMDAETLRLVIEIQLGDLESLKQSSKGKHRAVEVSDSELAIEAYKLELKTCEQLAYDRSMCESIAKANRLDGRLVSTLVAQEKQASRDRQWALRLNSGGPVGMDSSAHNHCSPEDGDAVDASGDIENEAGHSIDSALLKKLSALYVSADMDAEADADTDEYVLDQPESSSWAASRIPVNGMTKHAGTGSKKIECIGCIETYPVSEVARCPCNHGYCRDCLRSLFSTSLTDESLFPPRCCDQRIPIDDYRLFLSSEIVGKFHAKEVELSTPNRTYCHKPRCSSFVPTQLIMGDVATCPRCQSRTCTICKGAAHQNEDCQQDTAIQELLQVAAANGWQRCYNCRTFVELNFGCNHMTCRCGAQFCYVCGLKWKTCECVQWHEDRLYARANAILDRNPLAALLPAQRRERLVEREASNLRENHQCRHNRWTSRGGMYRCEECHDVLPTYIYECTRCRILACRRCRFNRL